MSGTIVSSPRCRSVWREQRKDQLSKHVCNQPTTHTHTHTHTHTESKRKGSGWLCSMVSRSAVCEAEDKVGQVVPAAKVIAEVKVS